MATDVYGTIAAADAYHAERGNTAWAAAVSGAKTAALVIASEWLDNKYGAIFPSYKTGFRAQIREWPRVGVVDWYGYMIGAAEIPREIENATYEVALRQIKTPGSTDLDVTLAKTFKSVSVQGAVSVTYLGAMTVADMQLVMPIVGKILQPIMTGPNANVSFLSGSVVR